MSAGDIALGVCLLLWLGSMVVGFLHDRRRERATLEAFASVWGVQRRPGESDASLRDRTVNVAMGKSGIVWTEDADGKVVKP